MDEAKAALAAEQPTMTVRERGEEHVVLSQLSRTRLAVIVPYGVACFRSRLVLAAVPQLQHLHLETEASRRVPPLSAGDSLELVPHLRSLHLEEVYVEEANIGDDSAVPSMADVLACLPLLTALCYWRYRLSVQDMLDIAPTPRCTTSGCTEANKRTSSARIGCGTVAHSSVMERAGNRNMEGATAAAESEGRQRGDGGAHGSIEQVVGRDGAESGHAAAAVRFHSRQSVAAQHHGSPRLADFVHGKPCCTRYDRLLSQQRHFELLVDLLCTVLRNQLTSAAALTAVDGIGGK